MTASDQPDFPPVQLDIDPFYRVFFEPIDYKPLKKLWEINVRLLDLKTEKELGKKIVRWPHKNPPENFHYDQETQQLVWENEQDIASLPIKLPDRRKDRHQLFQSQHFQPPKPNPQLICYSSFDEQQSPKKINLGTTKELILKVSTSNGFNLKASSSHTEDDTKKKENGSSSRKRRSTSTSQSQNGHANNANNNIVPDFIKALKKNIDFNPILEERLSKEQQVTGLKALSHYWNVDGTPEVLKGLLGKRFFDLWAINEFLIDLLQASGPSAINDPVFLTLLNTPSVLLFDQSFVQLAKAASLEEQQQLRYFLIKKTPNTVDPKSLDQLLDAEETVDLLEFVFKEFVVIPDDEKLMEKALDFINLLSTHMADKLLWINDEDLLERLEKFRDILLSMFSISKSCSSMSEKNNAITNLPTSVACPSTDYKIVSRPIIKTKKFKITQDKEED